MWEQETVGPFSTPGNQGASPPQIYVPQRTSNHLLEQEQYEGVDFDRVLLSDACLFFPTAGEKYIIITVTQSHTG
jgi:hypothetical protein